MCGDTDHSSLNLDPHTTGEATARPGMQYNRRFVFAAAVFVMVSAGVVARVGGCLTSAVGIEQRLLGLLRHQHEHLRQRSKRCGLHAKPGRQKNNPSSGVWTRGISIGCSSGGDSNRSRTTPAVPSSSVWSLPEQQADDGSVRRSRSTRTSATSTSGRSAQVAEAGVVYFVSTPIGNLEDITLR